MLPITKELEEKVKRLHAYLAAANGEADKALLEHCLQNAAQALANFYEVERIFSRPLGDKQ